MSQQAASLAAEIDRTDITAAQVQDLLEAYSRLLQRVAVLERDLARANSELRDNNADLSRKNATLEAVIESVPAGVVVADEAGRITYCNSQAAKTFGIEKSELLSKRLKDVRNARGNMLCEGRQGEREMEMADGTIRTIARKRSAALTPSGVRVGTVDLVEDRTERRQFEQKMAHRERLASIGEMAATVAHEIRNPLHAIEGFASLQLKTLQQEGDIARVKTYSEHIARGVRELNAIITNMLDFSRVDRFCARKINIVALVRRLVGQAVSQHEERTGNSYPIDWSGPDSLPAAVDEVQFSQAIRNLALNALEAMPGGGKLGVDIQVDAQGISIRIADSGPGVPPEIRHRIFSPFFTTKSRGTGLGLAVVAKTAALHGGRVTLESAPRGALFNLWIPHNKSQEH
jgi:PAS domain S-box-containing protein